MWLDLSIIIIIESYYHIMLFYIWEQFLAINIEGVLLYLIIESGY